jgi:hypothetical protein
MTMVLCCIFFEIKKIAFANFPAFVGLGYSLKNVIRAKVPQYSPEYGFVLWTSEMAHPWGSWLNYNGTLYYSHETGLIGVPSWKIFLANGGKQRR